MKINQDPLAAQEEFLNDHLSAAEDTPLRPDAFDMADEEKINTIKKHVAGRKADLWSFARLDGICPGLDPKMNGVLFFDKHYFKNDSGSSFLSIRRLRN